MISLNHLMLDQNQMKIPLNAAYRKIIQPAQLA